MVINQKGVGVVGVVVLAVLIAAAASIVIFAKVDPEKFQSVSDKIAGIITPKPPIGNLTPARDLRGTWKSSLSGKGLELYGQFTTENAVADVWENGDIELIIEGVENNIAFGTMRYFNLCGWGTSVVEIPGEGKKTISVPKNCAADTGAQPVEIRVSSSALDFGTVQSGEITATMQGSFTTDLMSGSMTMTFPPYGVVKGLFKLSRQRE
jgi:hypothetical protein